MKENIIKYVKVLGVALGVLLAGNLTYILLSILGYKIFASDTTSITLSGTPVILGETVLQLISNLFYILIILVGLFLGIALARVFKVKFLRFVLILLLSSVILNLFVTTLNLANEDIFNFIVNSTKEVTFITRALDNKWYLLFTALRDGLTTVLPVMGLGYLIGRALDNHKESKLFKLLRIRD